MGNCDICGKTSDLLRASIEGTEMDVCPGCASHGKVIYVPKPRIRRPVEVVPSVPEREERVIRNYASVIKNAREKSGLTQEDFAKKLNEKLSLMRSVEKGDMVPSLKLAEKLEKQLSVNLIEELSIEKVSLKSDDSKKFTLGDMIQIKKRKR